MSSSTDTSQAQNQPVPEQTNTVTNAATNAVTNTVPVKKKNKSRISFFRCVILFLMMVCAALIWMCATELGTRTTLNLVSDLSSQQLQFVGVSGRLSGHLEVQEIKFKNQELHLNAHQVQLDWSPHYLLMGKLTIAQLNILALQISSKPSTTPARLPEQIQAPIAIDIHQWAIGRLQIKQWPLSAPNQVENPVQLELRALAGQLKLSREQHQLIGKLMSDWGSLQVDATLLTQKPYVLSAQWQYQGQVVKNFPAAQAQGTVGGDLQTLVVQGKANAINALMHQHAASLSPNENFAGPQLIGDFRVKIQPFQSHFLQQLSIDLQHVNPTDFHAQAPHADLTIQAQLQPKAVLKNEAGVVTEIAAAPWDLQGQLSIENAAPAPLDLHGVPVRMLKTNIALNLNEIILSNTQVKLRNQGEINGQATIKLAGKKLPIVDANVSVSNVNLAQLASRLRSTQIGGKVQIQTKVDQAIYFQTQLSDARAKLNVEAKYSVHPTTHEQVLSLDKIALQAGGSQVSGDGRVQFGGAAAFQFQGQVRRFDPAFWWTMPNAQMDADFSIKGRYSPKLNWALDLSRFEANFRGQNVTGIAQVSLRPDASFEVQKLDVLWGKNSLSGSGIWGLDNEQLNLTLDAPYLNNFSVLLNRSMQGSAKVQAQLRGTLSEPAGSIKIEAQNIGLAQKFSLANLQAQFDMGKGAQGVLNLNAQAQQLRLSSASKNAVPATQSQTENLISVIDDMSLKFNGQKDQHKIDAKIGFADRSRVTMTAQGALNFAGQFDPTWTGKVDSLKLHGKQEIQLSEAWALYVSSQQISLGSALLQGSLGSLRLDKLDWKPGRFITKGQLQGLKALEIFNMFYPQERFDGDLKVQGAWDIALTEGIKGVVELKRQSGDVRVLDADGTAKPQNLGVQEVDINLVMGGLVPGSDAETVNINARAKGQRLGVWSTNIQTQLSKVGSSWALASDAPLRGNASAQLTDMQWLSYQFNPELSVKGKVASQFQILGTAGSPQYKGNLDGNDLEVAFASEGLVLPNGVLRAEIDTGKLNLKQLQFSNVVTMMPKHAHFEGLNWIGKRGEFNASGQVDWIAQTGSIQANWDAFPLLQRKDRWLLVSGQLNVAQVDQAWALSGKMIADGAYFKLPKLPPPSLSSDVLISRSFKLEQEESAQMNEKKAMKTKVDITLDMGPKFVFEGRGLNTLLAGSLRLRATDNTALTGHGSIQTNGGAYDGYGQQLEIERGILNFTGSVTNPSLNIRALRKGLAVEAGVDVFGTVAQPQARLVSEPNVPDAEKLSWLVLGRDAEQSSSNDASLLLSAAGALLGGDSGSNLPRTIVQGLGFDEFFIGPAESGGGSKLPSQTVAGSTTLSSNSSDKVISIGKRIKPGLVLSVERGISDASGALKMSWQVSKRVRIIGRSGTERSLDAKYIFSFN